MKLGSFEQEFLRTALDSAYDAQNLKQSKNIESETVKNIESRLNIRAIVEKVE